MFPALMYYGAPLPSLFPELMLFSASPPVDGIIIIVSLSLQVCHEKLN